MECVSVVLANSSGEVWSAAINSARISIRPERERLKMMGIEADSPGGNVSAYTSRNWFPDMRFGIEVEARCASLD
jgi:hypothetical protein